MERGYQYNFSDRSTAMYQVDGRQRKAKTMVSVLKDILQDDLSELSLLNVGGSAGIIDEYLSRYFGSVIGVDIDEKAIDHANNNFQKNNLRFDVGDAMGLQYENQFFDVVVCSQVYEHVPDASKMMREIFRVLKPGGVCYFAAGNRVMWNEPHYNLPLLSVIPRPLSHLYMRLMGKGKHYYEKHLSYWGLRDLVKDFELVDFTKSIVNDPSRFDADYMIHSGTFKSSLAKFVANYLYFFMPGYIWVLKRPQ